MFHGPFNQLGAEHVFQVCRLVSSQTERRNKMTAG
jgi:hypothetical protein